MKRRRPETPVPAGGRGRRIDGSARADYVIALLKIANDSA
jgi:hypothetical protein